MMHGGGGLGMMRKHAGRLIWGTQGKRLRTSMAGLETMRTFSTVVEDGRHTPGIRIRSVEERCYGLPRQVKGGARMLSGGKSSKGNDEDSSQGYMHDDLTISTGHANGNEENGNGKARKTARGPLSTSQDLFSKGRSQKRKIRRIDSDVPSDIALNASEDFDRSDTESFDKREELIETESLQLMPAVQESEPVQIHAYRVFKSMAPYIRVHYGSIVVIHIPGEVLESELADSVMHDIVLLKILGIKPVLVVGCRPQIRRRLEEFGLRSFFVKGIRVCDAETLSHCQSVAGHVRTEVESKLGRGLVNVPSGIGDVTVTSGNLIKAIPFGVRGGIDFAFTGTVQKVDTVRINQLLDDGDIVLLGAIAYSSSGLLHCRSEDVAVKAASDLQAQKLIFLTNGEHLEHPVQGVVHNLSLWRTARFADKLAAEVGEEIRHSDVDPMTLWKRQFLDYLQCSVTAVSSGVERVHLVSRHQEGSIVTELCTRDGTGIMISYELYDGVRAAQSRDVPSILNLIAPLEKSGILVTRPPELIESEIDRFLVFERDGEVLACCQLIKYDDQKYGQGAVEMSCVAVAPALQREGIGNALLSYCLRKAIRDGIHDLFVLTTRTAHWFIERGFEEKKPDALPPKKYAQYDHQRNPKVYFKHVKDEKQVDSEELIWFRNRGKGKKS